MYVHFLSQHFSQDWLVSFFDTLREVERPNVLKTDGAEFFFENSHLSKNGPKMPKMAQFIHLSTTTAFFSGLAH